MPTDPATADAPQLLIELRGVGKSFGGLPVLSDIDLRLQPGSVHALVGENGAGKSTLSKIIAGIYTADTGALARRRRGAELQHPPRGSRPRHRGDRAGTRPRPRALRCRERLPRAGAPHARLGRTAASCGRRTSPSPGAPASTLDPDTLVGSMRTADQQKVEILRALARGASLIIMDEPTAALSAHDTELLHGVVRQLAASGHTVLLISHFLSEVLELCDTVTILRDGHLIRTAPAADETEATLIEGMLGRTLGSVFPPQVASPDGCRGCAFCDGPDGTRGQRRFAVASVRVRLSGSRDSSERAAARSPTPSTARPVASPAPWRSMASTARPRSSGPCVAVFSSSLNHASSRDSCSVGRSARTLRCRT